MDNELLALIEELTKSKRYKDANAVFMSEKLRIAKNMVNMSLSRLYKKGLLIKIYSDATLFLLKSTLEDAYHVKIVKNEFSSLYELLNFIEGNQKHDFEKLIGFNESMNDLVKSMEATLSYPPQGLPILLNGPTGTGKSLLARLAYEYCINHHLIESNARFVQVNCSEYANNPELLSANLFGYKKGAFTGADKDNMGLLHYADGGLLFLDEVHCLKSECQEKLFLYMDQGIYHMIGDNDKWLSSKCRIIFATTEVPQKVLLKTLLRRIPIILQVPSLDERGTNEKLALIYYLYRQEEKRIKKDIYISTNAYQALLNYHFVGNVGELSNVVQASCVSALFAQQGNRLEIHASQLPKAIIQQISPLSMLTNKHEIIPISKLVPASSQSKIIQFYQSIIDTFDESQNDNTMQLRKTVDSFLEKIVFHTKNRDHYLIDIVNNIFSMVTKKYGFSLSNNEILSITSYLSEYQKNISEILTWNHQNQENIIKLKEYLNDSYHRQYLVALELYHCFKNNLNDALDDMVLCVLTVYLDRYFANVINNQTLAIIIAHGFSTASSIAESANKLLGQYIFDSIDMPLHVDTDVIVKKLNAFLSHVGMFNELYLLVDMGSLEAIYEGIQIKNIDIAMINNVHTKLALQIGEGLKEHLSMQEIFKDIEKKQAYHTYIEKHRIKEPMIVCSCATGLGVAEKIKTTILESLPENLSIKVMTYDYSSLVQNGLDGQVFDGYDIICVVGTLNPNIQGIRFVAIEDLIINTDYEDITIYFENYMKPEELKEFKKNILKNFSLSNIMNILTILNPNNLLEQVSKGIDRMQELLNIRLKNRTCFGLYVHICCLIERLVTHQSIEVYSEPDFSVKEQLFIEIVKESFSDVEMFYNVNIPVEEIGYIYDYVKNNESVS
ncbi:MAG: sigma 54-interacting transcriptional regulator [Kandleria vitulina]|uniref:sigma 54-interacting transcriptional regulator n=1 Tax=Kandleria vitulina TaxID=1630 RepID=UPI002E7AA403|nr:sigma 54-interacting transcriptional regulator [Kandleria vitulina]MEE0989680.1 sigma 54-interacting transcriptional regulator [Kandleria vitulina]